MKCVAMKNCQTHNAKGNVQFYLKGEVDDFKKCPPNFSPLEGKKAKAIDFDTAMEAELLGANFKLDDLKDYIEKKYDKKSGNRGLETTVSLLLDCRYRAADIPNDINNL